MTSEVKEKIKRLFPEAHEIPQPHRLDAEMDLPVYLSNGKLHEWDGPMKAVFSPVCIKAGGVVSRKRLGSFPLLSEAKAEEILNVAVQAYDNGGGVWPTMPVEERIKHVQDFVYRMKETREEVVRLLMWEVGKSLEDSQKEFDRTVVYIEDTIAALKDLDRISSRFVVEQGIIAQIRRAPLGVVLCMGPFNYPLNETFATLIPALIMGNTVVFKPPKHGVLLYHPLLKAFRDAFPSGVVNTVYGEGRKITPALMASGKINALALIGTSGVADSLRKAHPKPHRLRCILGLEAKNPGIILPDVDLDAAVRECVLGCLSFNGQRCTALKILFVHSKVAPEFIDRLSREIQRLEIGMPWKEKVMMTPLPEPGKPAYLTELIKDAETHGARVVNPCGGTVNETFVYPAVLFPVNRDMRIYHEEQFGPVIPVRAFDDIKTPIDYVVESNFGQQLSIFGSNPDDIAKLIDPLVNQVCRVNINSQCQRGPDTFPFTGRKDSAEATLSVSDALRCFSIRTLVAGKEGGLNKKIITDIVRGRKSSFLSTDFIL